MSRGRQMTVSPAFPVRLHSLHHNTQPPDASSLIILIQKWWKMNLFYQSVYSIVSEGQIALFANKQQYNQLVLWELWNLMPLVLEYVEKQVQVKWLLQNHWAGWD